MKIDPYIQRQKCRPMTLVSGNISLRHMRILVGRVGLLTTAIFGNLSGYFFGIFIEIRPAILYDDMLPIVGL